jgi:hypothetical protein
MTDDSLLQHDSSPSHRIPDGIRSVAEAVRRFAGCNSVLILLKSGMIQHFIGNSNKCVEMSNLEQSAKVCNEHQKVDVDLFVC